MTVANTGNKLANALTKGEKNANAPANAVIAADTIAKPVTNCGLAVANSIKRVAKSETNVTNVLAL